MRVMLRRTRLAVGIPLGGLLALAVLGGISSDAAAQTDGARLAQGASLTSAATPKRPGKVVKLIFVHHSTGENWLADDNGRLGRTLKANNYFVSDTNYGWGPDAIGDRTDTGQWWLWFRGSRSGAYMRALYSEFGQHSSYSRRADPARGRKNQIVMFKSCFPNSQISGNPSDPPRTGSNPLRGQDAGSQYMTVSNVKSIYKDLLKYFSGHQDRLFVLIVPPPLAKAETDAAHAANARAVANWLTTKWLSGYNHKNVAVFDFYNVLTSNGGGPNTSDLGRASGNHHRWRGGAVQHIQTKRSNFSAYPSGDSHPSRAGNLKATNEFVQLLNFYYQRWAGASS
jgi:hypothetical protein